MSFFEDKIYSVYGNELGNKIIDGSKKKKTTFRVNTLKTDTDNVNNVLTKNDISYSVSPFSENAFIIEEGEDKLRELDLFKNGEIYMQNLSSQLPPLFLAPKENEDILDMCAAPGGKTTQMAAICNNKCNITACEMQNKRAERLKYNLNKQGVKNANVMVTDARKLESYFSFDKILLDAPCSGSGTFDLSNENSYRGFTEILINKCMQSQSALLNKALSVLKVGGEMIYSTCSILPCENDEQVKKILKKHNCETVALDEEILRHLPLLPCSLENAICVCPTDIFEGFFVVKIRKQHS